MNRKCVERPIQQYPVQLVYDFPGAHYLQIQVKSTEKNIILKPIPPAMKTLINFKETRS